MLHELEAQYKDKGEYNCMVTFSGGKNSTFQCRRELSRINQSAIKSFDEGLGEILTLHRPGVFSILGISLKTTNVLNQLMHN